MLQIAAAQQIREAEVHDTVADQSLHVCVQALMQLKADAGVRELEALDHRREQAARDRRKGADAHRAALETAQVRRVLCQKLTGVGNAADARQKKLALTRE